MSRQTLHSAIEVWVREVIEMHQRSHDWAREAYRLEPSEYTAGQLAYCRVANSVARQLLSVIPKGFRFVVLPDDWRTLARFRGMRVGPRSHSEAAVRSAVQASEDMQAAVARMSRNLKPYRS